MSVECNARESLRSAVDYGRRLVGSGLEGAEAGARRALGEDSANEVLRRAFASSWKPGLMGVCVAVAASTLRRRNARTAVLNGLAGGAVAFSAALLWSSHRVTGAAARSAIDSVKGVRDRHWLEQHPIDYA